MPRLLGKTAIEVRDDYQVTLLVLASMSLKPKPGQRPSVAEAVSAMSADDRMSRVVTGITRLCEPFLRHWRGCHWKSSLPQTKKGSARQRLFELVDKELDRIGEFREMHQKIADADLGEASRPGWHLRPARKGTGEDLPPMAPSRPELDQTTDPPAGNCQPSAHDTSTHDA